MRTVFDIGMYDGADTQYYLDSGYRVIAVEANPFLVQRARERFSVHIADNRLVCINAAITADGAPAELTISADDLGSSSVLDSWVENKQPAGSVRVPGITMQKLLGDYGVPHFIKVDIEGADRWCVLALTPDTHPQYLSFEVRADFEELLQHAESIGFSRYKIINQLNFRELGHERRLFDRVRLGAVRLLGYGNPELIRRHGRFFVSGHSSGPAPWSSDGKWRSAKGVADQWRKAQASDPDNWRWYDVHAA